MAKTTEKWFKKGFYAGYKSALQKINSFIDSIGKHHFIADQELRKQYLENNSIELTIENWILNFLKKPEEFKEFLALYFESYGIEDKSTKDMEIIA